MKIALLGDIALFGCNNANNTQYKDKFNLIKKTLEKYDYVIGNLETPLTNAKKVVGGKSAYIKGTPEDVEILKYLNVSHVSLANNHSFDFCQEGLDETIKVLDNAGIFWYGIKGEKIEICDKDNRIIVMGYCCYSTNGKGMGIINELKPMEIEKELENNNDDAVRILSLHWGQEHVHYPNYDHILLAKKLSKGRKCIIHGHHPHVIQGVERDEDSLIAYSLGNFCFDDVYTSKSNKPLIELSVDNRETMILGIEIIDNKLINVEEEFFFFDSNKYIKMPEIKNLLRSWSLFLDNEEIEYKKKRKEDLDYYLNMRKKKRDLNWYIKRMNLESVKIIISAIYNKIKYDSYVKEYIV